MTQPNPQPQAQQQAAPQPQAQQQAAPQPHAEVPTFMKCFAAISLFAILIASFYYGTGEAAITNLLLGVAAFTGLYLLWITPSAARHVEFGEGGLGIYILLVGIAIGSSPTLYPVIAPYWKKTGLSRSLPIQLPKKEYFQYEESTRTIKATDKLPDDVHLVVSLPTQRQGTFVDANGGLEIPDDVKEVRVFLQHRVDDRTSSSIGVKTP